MSEPTIGDVIALVTQFRVDMMARFERVEGKLSAIQDDISVNIGRADRAAAMAEGNREELSLMWRMIKKLQTEVEELKPPPG